MTPRAPFYAPRIDDEIWAFIDRTNSFYPPDAVDQSIATQRRVYDEMCAAFRQARPDGLTVEDDEIETAVAGIPVRRYRVKDNGDPAATVVYYHGGGFVVGGLDSHDDICAEVAARTGFTVVSADYRLAPENLHPAAYEDSLAVYESLAGEGRPVLLCGDSAGGNLAAAVCLTARGRSDAPVGQVLIYPGLGGENLWLPSYQEESEAPLLTARDIMFYKRVRVPDDVSNETLTSDPTYAPLLARDFSGLAPCVIVTADCDPLRDDGPAYVKRLKEAGVQAEWINEPGLVHGFLRARTSSERAKQSFARICDALRRLGTKATAL